MFPRNSRDCMRKKNYGWSPLKMCGAREIPQVEMWQLKLVLRLKINSLFLLRIITAEKQEILNRTKLNTGLTCERILTAT